jgi:hypothetical protein
MEVGLADWARLTFLISHAIAAERPARDSRPRYSREVALSAASDYVFANIIFQNRV